MSAPQPAKAHVFIAHVEADAWIALRFAVELERHGYRTWCYEVDSKIGGWRERIRERIGEVEAVMVVVSPRSVRQPHQVSHEVSTGEFYRRRFVPVVCGISEDEYEDRVPSTWRDAFADYVRFHCTRETVVETAQELVDALRTQLGVAAGPVDDGRIAIIENELLRRPVLWWPRVPSIAAMLAWAMVVGAVGAVVWLVWSRLPWPPRPAAACRELTVWISEVPPPPDDPVLPFEHRELVRELDDVLSRAAEWGEWGAPLGFLGDADIDGGTTPERCAPGDDRMRCLKARAAARGVPAMVRLELVKEKTDTDKRLLLLELARSPFDRWERKPKMPADVDFSVLALHAAEHIAAHLARICGARLAPDVDVVRTRFQSLIAAKDAAHRSPLDESFDTVVRRSPARGPDVLLLIPRPAFADERLPVAPEIQDTLERLRAALTSQDVEAVARLYVEMGSAQKGGLRRYFAGMEASSLSVRFGPMEAEAEEDAVRVSFLRVDEFRDADTHEPVRIAIRVAAVLVRMADGWKIEAFGKAA